MTTTDEGSLWMPTPTDHSWVAHIDFAPRFAYRMTLWTNAGGRVDLWPMSPTGVWVLCEALDPRNLLLVAPLF